MFKPIEISADVALSLVERNPQEFADVNCSLLKKIELVASNPEYESLIKKLPIEALIYPILNNQLYQINYFNYVHTTFKNVDDVLLRKLTHELFNELFTTDPDNILSLENRANLLKVAGLESGRVLCSILNKPKEELIKSFNNTRCFSSSLFEDSTPANEKILDKELLEKLYNELKLVNYLGDITTTTKLNCCRMRDLLNNDVNHCKSVLVDKDKYIQILTENNKIKEFSNHRVHVESMLKFYEEMRNSSDTSYAVLGKIDEFVDTAQRAGVVNVTEYDTKHSKSKDSTKLMTMSNFNICKATMEAENKIPTDNDLVKRCSTVKEYKEAQDVKTAKVMLKLQRNHLSEFGTVDTDVNNKQMNILINGEISKNIEDSISNFTKVKNLDINQGGIRRTISNVYSTIFNTLKIFFRSMINFIVSPIRYACHLFKKMFNKNSTASFKFNWLE